MAEFPRDTVFYAIGDVHGMADRLKDLHGQIMSYHAENHSGLPIAMIHLGDYVDRGPDSCGVIRMIMELERQARQRDDMIVHSLRGNHEEMLLQAYDGEPSAVDLWLSNGGHQTLNSYDLSRGEDIHAIPRSHLKWMKTLPSYVHDKSRKLFFAHAGVDPKTFPDCNPQHYLWTRSPRFFRAEEWADYPAMTGYTVIHGHTPTKNFEPEMSGVNQRINVDTGAVFGGPLTAVVYRPGSEPVFLKA